MQDKKRSIRLGAAIVIFAVILRFGGGLTTASDRTLRLRQSVHIALQRWPVGGNRVLAVQPDEQPTIPTLPEPEILPTFTGQDLRLLQFRYASGCKYRPDLEELTRRALSWDLDSGQPTVLILHTHGTEAYTGGQYTPSGSYRTRDLNHNLVAVGELLANRLQAAGIGVIHDKILHDDPSYNAAYSSARVSVEQYLARYPSIQLVLDLHRDAASYPDGSQYTTSVMVDGENIAQLMLVMGTDASGLHHPNWQDNLSVALKMLVQLERMAPGVTRTTTLRTSRYNQDLHSAMLLVEVGSAGNTLQQAKAAVEILADAIIALKDGAN